jgi:hypothetical protein
LLCVWPGPFPISPKPTKTNLNQMLGNVRQPGFLASRPEKPKPDQTNQNHQTQSQKPLAR